MIRTSRKTPPFLLTLALIGSLLASLIGPATAWAVPPAQDTVEVESVSFPGSYGAVIGGADWAPDDPLVQATDADGDGMWELPLTLPRGDYEFKVAINGTWDVNYGAGGDLNGANVGLPIVDDETDVLLTYNQGSHEIKALVGGEDISQQGEPAAETPAEPGESLYQRVSFPGNYAALIGGEEWAPDDPAVQAEDADGDGIWTLTVELPGGDYEFKAAIDGSWDENYGRDGEANGPNVTLTVPDEGGLVTFFFNEETKEVYAEVEAMAIEEPVPELGDGAVGRGGLLHDSRSDRYRVPFGAVPAGTEVTLRLRTYAGDVEAVRLILTDESTGARPAVPMQIAARDANADPHGYDWWAASVDVGDAPTIHTYRFEIEDGDSVVYYVDGGQDGGEGNLSAPPATGAGWDIYTYVPGFESPDWAQNAVIYQIFPDRFRNGREENDPTADDWFYPDERGHAFPIEPWNTLVPDPMPVDPTANPDWYATWSSTFYGGDLQGILEQLDYLHDLGVTALYLNPIFESPSNHRYDGRTFDRVDDNLGIEGDWEASFDLLVALGEAAEDRGMRLILDGVPNHMSSDAYIFDKFERHEEEGACEAEDSPWRDWFFFREPTGAETAECAGDLTYNKWAGVSTLPQRDNTNPDVIADWLDPEEGVAVEWLEVPGVDGWRIDVVPDVAALNPEFFEIFRDVVKATHPDAVLYSETWREPDVRARVLGDEFDSTMNYRFRDAVLGFLRDTDWEDNDGVISALTASQFDAALRAIQEDYPPAAWLSAMNLIDSHDTNRAVRVLDHDGVDYGELEPVNGFEDGRQRLRLAAVLQFTLPGAPTVYYGDEVGLVGFGSDVPRDDPYNRQPYPWADEPGYDDLPEWRQADSDLLAHYQFLGQLRGEHRFLRTGEWTTLVTDDEAGLYVYTRSDETGAAVIALNRGDGAAEVEIDLSGIVPLDATLVDAITDEEFTAPISVTVESMDFRILVTEPDVDMSAPQTPQIEEATAGEESATVEATSDDPDAVTLLLYRSLVDGGYEPVQSVEIAEPGASVVITDEAVTIGTTYWYRVTAVNEQGMESAPTEPVALTPSYEIDHAQLLEPLELEHVISAVDPTEPLRGAVTIEDVTDAEGPTPGVVAEIGLAFAPPDATPARLEWLPGTYAGEIDGSDLYTATVRPDETGPYLYGWRFSTDGGRTWTYADASGIVEASFVEPGVLTVLPSEDSEAPNRPFRISEVFASPSQIVIEWRVSRTADLHHYRVCRQDVTAGETTPCTTTYSVPRGTQILTDTDVILGHTYQYTVQAVDTSFNRSEPSDVLSVEAAENFVDVTFRVRVPAFTPEGDVIFIAGDNRDVFGAQWNPVQPMEEVEENIWEYMVTVKEGTPLQYKYTRGSWETVEQWGSITGIANRVTEVTASPEGTFIEDDTNTDWDDADVPDDDKAVRNWRDPLVVETDAAADAVTVVFNSAVTPTGADDVIAVFAEGDPVPGTVAQTNETTFTFTPDEPLAEGSYTARVFNVATDVPMQQPYEWEFVVE